MVLINIYLAEGFVYVQIAHLNSTNGLLSQNVYHHHSLHHLHNTGLINNSQLNEEPHNSSKVLASNRDVISEETHKNRYIPSKDSLSNSKEAPYKLHNSNLFPIQAILEQ